MVKFLKDKLMSIYLRISGKTISINEKKSTTRGISHDILNANLFNLLRREMQKVDRVLIYIKKSTTLYWDIFYLKHKDFSNSRSSLDNINCWNSEFYEEYGFLFYGDMNRLVKLRSY